VTRASSTDRDVTDDVRQRPRGRHKGQLYSL